MLRRESAEQIPHLTQTVETSVSRHLTERVREAGSRVTWQGREEDGEDAEEDVRGAHRGYLVYACFV